MDLTLRTATPTQVGASENKEQSKAAGGDFANLNAQHFSGLPLSFSLPVDAGIPPVIISAESVDDSVPPQPSELSEVILSSALQAEPALDLAGTTVAIEPVKVEPMLESAAVVISPVKTAPLQELAGAAVFEQVEKLVQVNKRALSPSLSLASEGQDTLSRSAALRDVIRLANSNLNMQSANNLPVNHSAALDNVTPGTAILSSPALPVDNAAGKAIEWAKVDLTPALQNSESKQALSSRIGEKLAAVLHDRINLQASNNIKTAQIRLDPPDLGTITLNVRVEGDKVNINIASQSSVVREAIIQTSERLRHDLVSQNFVNVSVDISSGEQREAKKERHQQTQITSNTFNQNEPELENGRDEFIVKI